MRATIAVPGVFEPVIRGEQLLVDGGLLNNLPADVVREMGAQTVIAVDVLTGIAQQGECPMPNALSNAMDLCSRSIMVMMVDIHRHKMAHARPQVYLQPDIPANVGVLTGFTRADEIIAAGERAAREALRQIQALLASTDDGRQTTDDVVALRNTRPAQNVRHASRKTHYALLEDQ